MPKPSPLGPTKSKILEYLLFESRTAADIASHLRIQVSAARKHLERLRELGIVEEQFVRAGLGRPKKMYFLSAEGRELLPRRYDVVLNAVLDNLVRERGAAYAEAVMKRVATGLADAIGRTANRSRSEMQRFVAALSELGFMANLREEDGTYVITSRNCPILRAALAHRDVACNGLHGELIRVGAEAPEVQRERWIVEGAPFCTHIFSKEKKAAGLRSRGGPPAGSGPAGH